MNKKNQDGVSLIAAIFVIVVLAFMGVMFLTMVNTGIFTSVNDLQSTQALSVAEGGLENATMLLNTSTLANRITCAQVNANLNAKPLGQGQFTVTVPNGPNVPFYSTNAVALTAAIAATDVIIPVGPLANLGNYDASGRVVIDREVIDYGGKGTTAAACNPVAQPCLTGVVRWRDGTTAAAHASGAPVGQYQCSVTSTGAIPTVAAPTAQRNVKDGVQLQEGWAVGNSSNPGANRATLLRWNGTTWTDVSATLPANANQHLQSVSMLSYADVWAVGNTGGGAGSCTNGRILHWNGSAWSCFASPSTLNLNSVFMVSSIDGYAVGDTGAGVAPCTDPRMLRWNGASWSCINVVSALRQSNVTSIYMVDTNNDGIAEDGWAAELVSAQGGGTMMRWNTQCLGVGAPTGNWTECSDFNYVYVSINSVFMLTPTYGWAVGDVLDRNAGNAPHNTCTQGRSTLMYFDPASNWWECAPAPATTAVSLKSVFLLSITDGWAVGASNGQRPAVFRWDTPCGGGALTGVWNDCTSAAYVPAVNTQLNSVYCVDANDCWAVGNSVTPGTTRATMLHWDGTVWSSVAAPATALWNLNEVYIIGPEQRPQAAWQEVVK